jgi:cytochrome c-type biogenesis protein CcmH
MSAFIVLAALLVAAVLIVLLYPLLRGRRGALSSMAATARNAGVPAATDGAPTTTTGVAPASDDVAASNPSVPTTQASNVRIYAEQLGELDEELGAGVISREQWQASRTEIERRALEEQSEAEVIGGSRSPAMAVAVGLLVPVLAVGLYAWLGNPAALSPAASTPQAAVTPERIQAMVEGLAARMQANPEDTRAWIMLGRSYAVLGRYPEAVGAYQKAAAQQPENADLLADLADAMAMAKQRTFDADIEKVLQRALKIDPDNLKALVLAGTAAFERKAYPAALAAWERAAKQLPPEAEVRKPLDSGIAEARSRLAQTRSGAKEKATKN